MPEVERTDSPDIELPAGLPSIDTATWVEPKEVFPGEVIVSAYRNCPPGYMEPNQFRTQRLPRPIVQWVLHVKRLDQVWQNRDGSQDPYVYYYGGFDMERLNTTGETPIIEPINLRANKEARISNAWKALFGTISPPEVLVGKKATFEFYPSLRMQRGNVAKNVLIPVAVLPPDYEFTGEKRVIVSKREDTPVASDGQDTPDAVAQTISLEEAYAQLPEVLSGRNVNDLSGIINGLPQALRSSDLIDRIISGAALQSLQDEGKIAVGADGTIAVA